jgi:hypothetical protein
MLEHRRSEDRPAGTRDGPVGIPGRPWSQPVAGTSTARRPARCPPGNGPGTEPGDGEGPVTAASAGAGTAAGTGTGTEPDIAALLPAARAARDRVLDRGSVLTRDTLAAQLRRDGHPVRTARVSQLLTTLKRESPEAPARDAGQEPAGAGAGRLVLDAVQ